MGQVRNSAERSSGASWRGSRRAVLQEILVKVFGRRRRILVHYRYQIKSALLGVTGMGFLVGLMIFILYKVNVQSTRELVEVAPFLKSGLMARDREQLVMLIAGGLLFIAGMFLIGILESHKTAGVVHNVRRRLEELRSGRFTAKVTLRKHDNFPELATTFNEMAASLRARTEGELATLGRLAAQTSDLLREENRGNRAGVLSAGESLQRALQELQARKAELLEP